VVVVVVVATDKALHRPAALAAVAVDLPMLTVLAHLQTQVVVVVALEHLQELAVLAVLVL
jgi:hypothetical protein